ncbi:RDD family protein [Ilumatobacter nonamiensis]|uniref:RDD family protein n=1 Tax=Ilumatobacter nonamiensis TaxID=467093 RepID=UPI00034B0813|nr:RDD family protein [Ilumatobacter nonamiensis]
MIVAPVQSDSATGSVPPADDTGIITPEAVVLDIDTAGFASRILAGLIDITVQLAVIIFAGVVLEVAFVGDQSTARTALAFVFFVVLFGYPIAFETLLRGRTPGKMALSIRAVTIDGAPIRLRESTLRSMGGVVDKLLPPGGITGALFVLTTPRHQRVGDLIAGTIVIRDPERFTATPALWFTAPFGYERYAESIDPTAITVEQYTVIRSFLTRGQALASPIRWAIALDLADRLARSVGHVRPPTVHPEAFLICAMARYQRRNGPGRSAASPPAHWTTPGMPGPPGAGPVPSLDG